jgi:hypothetical protein
MSNQYCRKNGAKSSLLLYYPEKANGSYRWRPIRLRKRNKEHLCQQTDLINWFYQETGRGLDQFLSLSNPLL